MIIAAKKLSLKLFLFIFFFVTFFLSVNKVNAANISQWCYGTENIIRIGVDSSNNVWAIGQSGHIGMFNGLEWKRKADSSPGSGYDGDEAFMDTVTGKMRIWLAYGTGYNYTGVSYWTESTGWVYAGLLENQYTLHGLGITVDKFGGVWGFTVEGGIYKWNGATGWSKMADVERAGQQWQGLRGFYYDSNSHRIYLGWEEDGNSHYSNVSYYDIVNGTGYWYPNSVYDGDIESVIVKDGSVYMLHGSSLRRWNGSSWSNTGGFNGRMHYYLRIANNDIWACGSIYNTIGTVSGSYTWPFGDYIYDVAGGNHGESFVAGNGGRFAVLMGGAWYQDSSVFSDYVLSATKDAAELAKDSAVQAKNAAVDAYNKTLVVESKLDALQTSVSNDNLVINNKLDSLQTNMTNMQTNITNIISSDTTPPAVKIRTVSGALATSGGSIQVVLDISDNLSSAFSYSLDGSLYESLPVNRIVTLPLAGPGPNIKLVWVKDQAGNVGASSITIRKL